MKLSIVKKIAFPFAILLLLMAVMAATSFIGQRLSRESIETFRAETAKQAVAADVRLHFSTLLMAVNDYIITGKREYCDEYQKQRKALHTHLLELRSTSLSEHERRHLDSLQANIELVEVVADSILNKRVVPVEKNAASLMEEMDYRYGDRGSEQLTGFYDAITDKVNAGSDRVLAMARQGFWFTLIPFLFAFTIAVTVIVLTMQRISKPLMQLVLLAERITSRDFSTTLNAESEDEIGSLILAFQAMAGEIKRRYDELESFAYIVAHDLKNPIAGIRGMTEATLADSGDKLDADGKENLALMLNAADTMIALINDLLDFARAGNVEFASEPISVNEILDGVQRDMMFYVKERHATIVVSPNLPAVQCDPIRFSQIWRNLLSNAIKYNDKPQPLVEITCDSSQPNVYQFHVRDNGIGLDEKDFERIFQPFKRATTTGKYEGTGIGLAIVKRVVDFHGGRIWVTSKVGEGTTFHFTMPKILEHRANGRNKPA
jgi:signal transduction histidine kinase